MDEREMELEEWCAQLPSFHAVNRRLRHLLWVEEHPIQAWWQRQKRRLRDLRFS